MTRFAHTSASTHTTATGCRPGGSGGERTSAAEVEVHTRHMLPSVAEVGRRPNRRT